VPRRPRRSRRQRARRRAQRALDDVAAFAELAQHALGFLRYDPSPGGRAAPWGRGAPGLLARQTSIVRLASPASSPAAQVAHARMAGGLAPECLVEGRPTVGVELPLEAAADFLLAARAELQGDQPRGAARRLRLM